jgi:hypothetical protein
LILRQKALDPGDPIKPYQFSARSIRRWVLKFWLQLLL